MISAVGAYIWNNAFTLTLQHFCLFCRTLLQLGHFSDTPWGTWIINYDDTRILLHFIASSVLNMKDAIV